jgi:hypothetical protein
MTALILFRRCNGDLDVKREDGSLLRSLPVIAEPITFRIVLGVERVTAGALQNDGGQAEPAEIVRI